MTRWRVLGSSVPGTLHIKDGRGCDDAHGWATRNDLTVLAVADGAGSRPGTSCVGAQVAVAAALDAADSPDFSIAFVDDPDAATAGLVVAAREALSAEAAALGLELTDLATTLCVAVIGRERVTAAQVGDGIAVLGWDDGLEAVAIAERFEYANEVVFLTAPDALEHMKIGGGDTARLRAIALSTDGLRYKVLNNLTTGEPFEQFFRDAWRYARQTDARSSAISSFLAAVDDQTGDDKTLVLAVTDFDGDGGERQSLTPRPELATSDNTTIHDPAT